MVNVDGCDVDGGARSRSGGVKRPRHRWRLDPAAGGGIRPGRVVGSCSGRGPRCVPAGRPTDGRRLPLGPGSPQRAAARGRRSRIRCSTACRRSRSSRGLSVAIKSFGWQTPERGTDTSGTCRRPSKQSGPRGGHDAVGMVITKSDCPSVSHLAVRLPNADYDQLRGSLPGLADPSHIRWFCEGEPTSGHAPRGDAGGGYRRARLGIMSP